MWISTYRLRRQGYPRTEYVAPGDDDHDPEDRHGLLTGGVVEPVVPPPRQGDDVTDRVQIAILVHDVDAF
jgi:hypothetical protein